MSFIIQNNLSTDVKNLTFKNHMWDAVGHVVAANGLTEHPAGADDVNRALGKEKEESNRWKNID